MMKIVRIKDDFVIATLDDKFNVISRKFNIPETLPFRGGEEKDGKMIDFIKEVKKDDIGFSSALDDYLYKFGAMLEYGG